MSICRALLFAVAFGSVFYGSQVDSAFTPSFLTCIRTGTEGSITGLSNLAASEEAVFVPARALFEVPKGALVDCSKISSGSKTGTDKIESSKIYEQLLKEFDLSLEEEIEIRDSFDNNGTPFLDEVYKCIDNVSGECIKGRFELIESNKISNVQLENNHYNLRSEDQFKGEHSKDVIVSFIRTFEYDPTSEANIRRRKARGHSRATNTSGADYHRARMNEHNKVNWASERGYKSDLNALNGATIYDTYLRPSKWSLSPKESRYYDDPPSHRYGY